MGWFRKTSTDADKDAIIEMQAETIASLIRQNEALGAFNDKLQNSLERLLDEDAHASDAALSSAKMSIPTFTEDDA